jgi:ankyrin repeat protein
MAVCVSAQPGISITEDDAMMPDADALKYYEAIHHLFVASIDGNVHEVQAAIDAGADVNARHHMDQDAPLHLAAAKGHAEVVRVLLKNGADPRMKNDNYETPAYLAACAKPKKVFDILEDWAYKGVVASGRSNPLTARANQRHGAADRGVG